MKYLLILAATIAVVMCQRPPYAALPQRYPQPHPWFTTEASAVDLGNRAGGTTQSTTTQRIPVDARGDHDLYNQIASWPKEKQPYWYLNWKAIEEARGRPQPNSGPNQPLAQPGLASRSSFLNSGRQF